MLKEYNGCIYLLFMGEETAGKGCADRIIIPRKPERPGSILELGGTVPFCFSLGGFFNSCTKYRKTFYFLIINGKFYSNI